MASFFDDDSQPQQDETFFTQTGRVLPNRAASPVAGPSRARRKPSTPPRAQKARVYDADEAYGGANGIDDELEVLDPADEGDIVSRLSRRWMNERSCPEILENDAGGELSDCLQTLLLQVRSLASRFCVVC